MICYLFVVEFTSVKYIRAVVMYWKNQKYFLQFALNYVKGCSLLFVCILVYVMSYIYWILI